MLDETHTNKPRIRVNKPPDLCTVEASAFHGNIIIISEGAHTYIYIVLLDIEPEQRNKMKRGIGVNRFEKTEQQKLDRPEKCVAYQSCVVLSCVVCRLCSYVWSVWCTGVL